MDKFDLSRVPENGYLIFPVSMSRIANAHYPGKIYEFLEFFESKVSKISIDVVILYTDGLYINTAENALEFRKKTINQILDHKAKFINLLLKNKKYIPQAFHFLPWDYLIVNSPDYIVMKNNLDELYKTSEQYQKEIENDLKSIDREATPANVSFLMEETILSHLLQQKQIPLPNTLTSSDGWRLICYPGTPISSWRYLVKNKILPQNENSSIFAQSFYNMEDRVLENLVNY